MNQSGDKMNILSNLFERLNSFFGSSKATVAEESIELRADLSSMKVSELKAEAKNRGLKGYSSLRKSELIKLLGE